jgi:hypothetical protein
LKTKGIAKKKIKDRYINKVLLNPPELPQNEFKIFKEAYSL